MSPKFFFREEILNRVEKKRPVAEILDVPFWEVLWPWIGVAKEQLRKKAGKSLSLLSAKALLSLEISLLKRWSALCTSSFSFEMQIHRAEFSLKGSTPRKRYLNFIEKRFFNREELCSFFDEYKELVRLVETYLLFWVDQAAEFLFRLDQDLPLLSKAFHKGALLGKVDALKLNAGDVHCEGRSVSLLTFECGKSVLYKPKNIEMPKIFHSFLDRLKTLGLKPILKSYTILARGDYGWEEKVEFAPCKTREEVKRFYTRAGMYLCLTYLFDGIDIHYENIIASKDHPFLIDLETLFHAHLRSAEEEADLEIMQHSVLVTGLLPFFHFGANGEKGRDVSGLGQEDDFQSMPKWKNLHTDAMQQIEVQQISSRTANQVIYRNQVQSPSQFIDFIVKGFTRMYTFIQRKKGLLAKEGWFSQMAECPVRILIRSTRVYHNLLKKLHEPHAILNKELKLQRLNLLHRNFWKKEKCPLPVIEEEKRALCQGDVPCFHAFPSSKDLFVKTKRIACNCLDRASFERVAMRLKAMGKSDRNLQETFIRRVFHAKQSSVHSMGGGPFIKRKAKRDHSEEHFLQRALEIGLEVEKRGFKSKDGSLGWICLEPNLKTEQYQLLPIGDTLFAGRVGVALFFAALFCLSKEKKWEAAALNTLKPLRKKIEMGKGKLLLNAAGIGGMLGLGGIAYGFFHIGRILNLLPLIAEAKRIFSWVQEKHIREDRQYDVVLGSAGLLLALLSFYKHFPSPRILALMKSCGKHLQESARDMGKGCFGWSESEGKPLLGFSHGTAGIAYALFQLAALTHEPELKKMAQGALSYERSHFCPKEKNWPHFKKPAPMCSWCHGATGIGLGRLGSLSSTGKDPEILQEIEVAIETTRKNFHQGPLSLCCGPLGRLEFLREASRKLARDHLDEEARREIYPIFQETKEEFHNPGFMQGSSGIGFTLLRLLDKKGQLPQVLLLQ